MHDEAPDAVAPGNTSQAKKGISHPRMRGRGGFGFNQSKPRSARRGPVTMSAGKCLEALSSSGPSSLGT
jgi:hypothetical protein